MNNEDLLNRLPFIGKDTIINEIFGNAKLVQLEIVNKSQGLEIEVEINQDNKVSFSKFISYLNPEQMMQLINVIEKIFEVKETK